MDSSIRERCERLGEYVIESGSTVRATAQHFGVSKSTVHKDLTEKLRYYNPTMHSLVKQILEKNKLERHIRGGEATRKKYLKEKDKNDWREVPYPDLYINYSWFELKIQVILLNLKWKLKIRKKYGL